MSRVLLFIFFGFLFGELSAQDWRKDQVTSSENTNISKKKTKTKKRKDEKDILFIIKNSPSGLLYGNPCMKEETRKMGFEYVVQRPGLPGTLIGTRRITNNLGVHTKLVFTRSPFWKLILNKRVKDCREKSGDWVG